MSADADKSHSLRQVERARKLYDNFSETFLSCAGDTFQAGLVRSGMREDPRASNIHLSARAGIQPGQRILDAGCGVCGPSIHIAQHYPTVHIDAVTVSPVQVRIGRERIAQASLSDRVRVHLADYHHLPFPTGHFDVVLFLECTGYSDDPVRLFTGVHRVLAPGGIVYIKDVFQKETAQTEDERREQREFDEMWALHASPTLSGTLEALRQAGFTEFRPHVFDQDTMGGFHFIGSMFGGEGLHPFELNGFGRHFYRSLPHLPSYFGEIIARKPT